MDLSICHFHIVTWIMGDVPTCGSALLCPHACQPRNEPGRFCMEGETVRRRLRWVSFVSNAMSLGVLTWSLGELQRNHGRVIV